MSRKSGITSNTLKQKAENKEITKLQSELEHLKLAVRSLQHRLDIMEAKALVSSQVTNMLEKEVDHLNQYGRRSSLVIKGIPLKERETNDGIKAQVLKIIREDLQLEQEAKYLDNTHRIGPKHNEGKMQDIIVQMKSHSSRYAIYNKRKTGNNKNIKITPSITNKRRTLLANAKSKFEGHPAINLIYIDINGDLKVRLNEPIKNSFAFPFEDIDDIENLFMTLTNEPPENDGQ